MKCKSKTNKLEFFMTKNDELEFSSIIKKKYQDIVFIDAYTWDSKEVVLRNSISECYSAKNSRCVILNTKILSLKWIFWEKEQQISVQENFSSRLQQVSCFLRYR